MARQPYRFGSYMEATNWLKQQGYRFETNPAGEERMGSEMRHENGSRAIIQAARQSGGIDVAIESGPADPPLPPAGA
jgi:hypothetical protein